MLEGWSTGLRFQATFLGHTSVLPFPEHTTAYGHSPCRLCYMAIHWHLNALNHHQKEKNRWGGQAHGDTPHPCQQSVFNAMPMLVTDGVGSNILVMPETERTVSNAMPMLGTDEMVSKAMPISSWLFLYCKNYDYAYYAILILLFLLFILAECLWKHGHQPFQNLDNIGCNLNFQSCVSQCVMPSCFPQTTITALYIFLPEVLMWYFITIIISDSCIWW